ncbi:MAG: hypothetical protein N2B02_06840, partial [Amylibacter sp.]
MSHPSFFAQVAPLQPADIATKTGAELKNGAHGNTEINSAGPIEAAVKGAITFLDNSKYLEFLATTSASAVFCKQQHGAHAPDHLCVLIHPDPYAAYA